jgi:hypothetical protein
MAKGFASLGDKMADKKVACRVRGCPRTWMWRGPEQVKAFSAGHLEPPARMCDLCHARAQMLEEREIPCAAPGCPSTFVWNKLSQLEAILKHTGDSPPAPPRHLCEACRGKVRELADRHLPCRVKGCTRTWTFTGRAQLQAGIVPGAETTIEPPSRMCDACHEVYESLADQRRPCKVRGCQRGFVVTRWQRLEAMRAAEAQGVETAPFPERMCDECAHLLSTLKDEDVACRTEGCDGTWVYRRSQKLEALLANPDEAPTPPPRMCPGCQSKLSHLCDRSVPCKRGGCRRTWLFKRGTQLERWIKHGEGPETAPPQRLCDECRKKLDHLKDHPIQCKNEGCKGTWVWTRFAQLAHHESGSHGPPSHMCDACREFLMAHPAKTLSCQTCQAHIHWSSEFQLRTHFGLMQEPTLCGACKRSASSPGKPLRA